ncbi:MAG: hypothetical protein HND44_09235 [Chloroflexi bacterium]|nr:hypothetical protein [Ardenticatenaceae bacterium]NOG34742.1 hypothetical protein [Chloroflexota bacterium]GIK55047.1 MAG: hypothetical protein BroJett015_07100 [Chloroflexota bacterium]
MNNSSFSTGMETHRNKYESINWRLIERKRSDLTSLLPEAVAAIQAQKLVKSPEELNGYD